jgi:lipopolysaccharide biosynthesis glycosyltransferase
MNNKYINIVTSGDRAAYISICALLNSIILNHKTNKKLRIYIVCESAIELNELINRNCYVESLTDKIRQDMAAKSNIKLIEPPNNIVEEIINKQSFKSGNIDYMKISKTFNAPVSVYNFIRFYFPELLPDSVNKVIYLDTDMIVKGEIEELFNLLEEKYELGGVFCKFPYIITKDRWIKPDYLSSFSRNNIFNAGMYVTYLNKWRENNYTHQCMSIVEANKSNNFYNGGTQIPMNIVFSHSTQEIPQEWNQTGLGEFKRPVSSEFETNIMNAKILHWTGGMKPWLSKKNDLYTHFAEQWYVYFNKEGVDLTSIQIRDDVNFKNRVLRLQKSIAGNITNIKTKIC